MLTVDYKHALIKKWDNFPHIKIHSEGMENHQGIGDFALNGEQRPLAAVSYSYFFLERYPVKKMAEKILIYKEIRKGAGAMSNVTKGFLIYEEMREYLAIYEEAISHI